MHEGKSIILVICFMTYPKIVMIIHLDTFLFVIKLHKKESLTFKLSQVDQPKTFSIFKYQLLTFKSVFVWSPIQKLHF
jgi:hypothetical protein